MHQTDRRVIRTRRQLREALMALILEKGFDAVTVEDITRRADVGRTTFYLHFRDKDDLLMDSIEAVIVDLKEQVLTKPLETWYLQSDSQGPILPVFYHVAENATLYRIILSGEGATSTTTRLTEIIRQNVIEFINVMVEKENLELKPLVPLEIYAAYFASSLLGFIFWWVENGMRETPEEITAMFTMLIFYGGRYVLGLPA